MTLTRINTNSITDGSIVNADISASAAIAGTKISPDFGSQNIVTTGGLTVDTNTLVVDAPNNRVGIGTTSPQVDLQIGNADGSSRDIVVHTVNNGNARLRFREGGTIASGYNEYSFGMVGTANAMSWESQGLGELGRWDSGGRLLVGTTASYNVGSTGSALLQSVVTSSIPTGSFTRYTNDNDGAIISLGKSRGTSAGSFTVIQSGDIIGNIRFAGADGTDLETQAASIRCEVDGTPNANDMPGRIILATTADGASSPTERLRITNLGKFGFNESAPSWSFFFKAVDTATEILGCQNTSGNTVFYTGLGNIAISSGESGTVASLYIRKSTSTNRSINAAGTVNASGADYAEYMAKAGDFDISKGAVCGVTADGLLTLDYSDAVSFVVKSTNPSYVGGDTWGSEDVVGPKPDAEDAEALGQWEADLEAARQKVDRIAFAGQVPVNVMGATPGQYIVPVEAADGGIEGIAKNEADLTLAEYMRAVGKVIAIEDDGRARIIVKVV